MNIIKTRLLRALEHAVVKSAIEQSRLNGQYFQYVSILLEPLPFKPESAFPGMGRTSPASLLVDAGSAAHLLILLCQEPVDGAAGAFWKNCGNATVRVSLSPCFIHVETQFTNGHG